MDRDLPRAPWPMRFPSAVRSALSWCAAALFALVLFLSTTYRMSPPFGLLRPVFVVGLGVRAALAVALALPAGWSLRRPERVLGVLLAESAAVALLLGEQAWPFHLATDGLIGWLAAVRPRRVAALSAAASFGVWLVEEVSTMGGAEQFSDFASTAAAAAAGIAIPWAVGNSVRQQRRYREALRAHAADRAIAAERLRIARELHDVVAHSIGVIAIQSGAARLVLDVEPAGARRALDAIEATSRETLAGLRRMLVSLRRAGDPSDAAPPAGLEAVDRLAETMAQAGVEVQVRRLGQPRPLPPEIDLAAFRIVQESVTNVLRHAGVGRCEVRIDYREGELDVEVVDEGCGSPPGRRAPGTGYGISGMRERVALLHGRFSAGARPGGGFRVAARLPA
ncbi:sensor histidine kinase [Kitasatospora sp. NPDC059646]|uniref:sensor histidine kinase n=1 Tax=Kitasatospora sp. NPDC059646 TaxID=3346893 RepID=UPI0036B1A83E